ncbi:hypothetical protein BC937DRAFT_88032 [Endogone sp. FLAS-F59071]|nr:hypothetical protein BC937DRAFT_88032 [Endogone sp. FLAS-F59071]|eukprot:RUS19060.1 hypothetical protein BC937DRAFT_88032 [Endogone sp. FLAS-F59071]
MNADSNSWSLPIEYFFDLTHLSQHARFFTISDFISMQLEAPQRQWSNDTKTELLMIHNIYTRAALLHMDNEAHRHTSQILKYSTPKGAELYEETVFKFLKYAPEVYEAAEHVLLNLTDKLEGRPFISMHFRRGDFATYQWLDGLESERTLLQTVGNAVTELNQWYASLGGQGSNASTARYLRVNMPSNLIQSNMPALDTIGQKFVESVPKMIKENVPKEEAEKIKKTLEALGATVVLE